MEKNVTLLLLVAAGAALCWLPIILEPSLGLPAWVPLTVIAASAALATFLSGGYWLRFSAASAVGTLAGVLVGYAIWPMADGIAQSYVGLAALVATLAVFVVSLVASLIGRWITVGNQSPRRAARIVFAGCIAFGPLASVVRPSVVAHRTARNNELAKQRFESLKLAVERTRSEPGDPGRICDGRVLEKNYSGPQFGSHDWRYIAGNYVQEDGYVFGIWVDCSQPSRYTIDVRPAGGKTTGGRTFCADESGRTGCGAEWNRSWEECVPCAQ